MTDGPQAGQYLSFAQASFIAILKQQKVISELVVQNTSSAIDTLTDTSKKCEDLALIEIRRDFEGDGLLDRQ